MVEGKIAFSAGSTVPTLEASNVVIPQAQTKVEDDADTDMPLVKLEPGTEPASSKLVATERGHARLPDSLFVGDLRLASLKARLAALAIPAEFAGEGLLVCGPGIHQGKEAKGGSMVAVRKLNEGRIVLEGSVGKVYFDVRRELYSGFAMVTAG